MKILKKIMNYLFPSKEEIDISLGGGLIGIGKKETDYLLGASLDLISKIKLIEDFKRLPKYEYNQGAQIETKNWCTIYSAITELSYLFDYKFTLCQIKDIGNRMIKDKKLDPNVGAFLSDAIDYTRKWWNENFPESRVSSYRFSYLDKTIRQNKPLRFLGLTQLGYKTSAILFNEIQTNGFANKKDYPKGGGHAVSTYGINIIDNYFGKIKRNRYSFSYMDELIKNGVIFEDGYIFIKD